MDTYTLDTNCLLSLERDEPISPFIRAIVRAHSRHELELAIPAVSALENQPTGAPLRTLDQFTDRLQQLGVADVPLIYAIDHFGIGFYGVGYLADQAMVDLERRIHEVLHPTTEYSLQAFCSKRRLVVDTAAPPKKWRNAKCDVQILWSHIHDRRTIFISDDDNFFKATKASCLCELGAARILRPSEAAAPFAPAA